MKNSLARTYLAIDDCEAFIKEVNIPGSAVESYLTQYLLVLLCADMQQEIYDIVIERSKKSNDPEITKFMNEASKKTLRSVKKGEIAGFIKMFSEDAVDKFNSALEEKDITIYNNAVTDRHEVAHRTGALITFGELKEAVTAAERILKAVGIAIS